MNCSLLNIKLTCGKYCKVVLNARTMNARHLQPRVVSIEWDPLILSTLLSTNYKGAIKVY